MLNFYVFSFSAYILLEFWLRRFAILLRCFCLSNVFDSFLSGLRIIVIFRPSNCGYASWIAMSSILSETSSSIFLPQFWMLYFSPSEHDRQFHFVTFFQEFPDLISLVSKSPFAIFGRYLSSFTTILVLFFLESFALEQPLFSIVHDSADRWVCIFSDFNEVKV